MSVDNNAENGKCSNEAEIDLDFIFVIPNKLSDASSQYQLYIPESQIRHNLNLLIY